MKRKLFLITTLLLLSTNLVFGAWDKTKPTDTDIRKQAPSQIRTNWEAIELGTDSALQITNAKVAASAAIVDTKLAQITTAGKVSGTALTGFVNIPSGAGVIPAVNIPTIDGAKLGGLGNISSGAGTIPAANLGSVAQKGANSDITSLSGLTTALSTAQGGTGTTANANAANGVVKLDGSAKLPALDGSQLTGITGIPSGVIVMWHGSIATIPAGWVFCNGSNGTPDLRDRFVIAADADSTGTYNVSDTGDGTIPAHTHTFTALGINGGGPYGNSTGNSYTSTTSSYGTGTKVIATYYALAYIMKT